MIYPVMSGRQTRGFFAVIGPGRRPVGERIEGAMVCGPALRGDDDLSAVFTASSPVVLSAPGEAITDECDEAGRIGFFSSRGALMWAATTRAMYSGQRLDLPRVCVIDGT